MTSVGSPAGLSARAIPHDYMEPENTMTNRITNAMLKSKVEDINDILGMSKEPWTQGEDGKMRASVGTFYLDGAYGGVSLVQLCNESGGVHSIIGRGTKRELYEQLCAMYTGIRTGISYAKAGKV